MNDNNLFGLRYELDSKAETISKICASIDSGRKCFVRSDLNVATIVNCQKDPILLKAVNSSDLINIDGMGALWGAKLLDLAIPERVAGVDLFTELLEVAEKNKYSVYFLGATSQVLTNMIENVSSRLTNLKIAGYNDGYFWGREAEIVDQINASGANMLFIGIKSPEKEMFIYKWAPKLNVEFVMGVGGSFDVVSGKVKRAPRWMQNSGLEWAFRIYQEPRRMWKRYLTSNFAFLKMLIQRKLETKS